MTTYEQLHKKICELIPEIKELKFGCKIKIKHESIIDYYIDDCVLRTDQFKMPNSIKFIETINGKKISSDSESFEIIGRDITLEDVLKAIDPFGNYGCVASHIVRVDRKKRTYGTFLCKWQLGKPLHEQSEDTQKAILDLLQ